ncbi:SpaA isopeptide-forming pilin-related protein [Leifsonia virtsii]|uniref:SpaA isopeptide-forming pilin-related protein n=1 Tax=Leifsonia virtsii TaxID=3035915 RepID=A0ABT8ITH8_9MICO|nr:SpaA isopeptide-forming pilin-related protein [Leifsonia virtsii]MDN4595712.1 SpaA isopeptide-forming pilin-related protein [Leifsonia virtsii]
MTSFHGGRRRRRRARTALALTVWAVLGVLLAIGAAPQHVSLAAAIPTIGCDADPNIFNTGYSQSKRGIAADGAVEERWSVAAGTGDLGLNWGYAPTPQGPLNPSLPGTVSYSNAYVGKVNNAWLTSPFNNAQWISGRYVPPATGRNQNSDWGNFYYQYTFQLDPKVDAATFRLAMDWYADNTVRGVWVNGRLAASTTQSPYDGWGFKAGNQVSTVLGGFVSGATNTILVQVGSTSSAEGFMAQVTSTALCPTLTVAKTVSGARVYAADQFTVAAKDGAGATLAAATTSGTGVSASAATRVAPGTYTIAETLAPGSQAAPEHYNGVLTCADRTNPGTTVATSGAYPSWTVTIPVGAPHDYLCTVMNAAKSFSVSKTVEPPPPAVVHPGEKVSYTVVVKNTGGTAFSGVGADVASFVDDLSRVRDDATYNGDATGGAVLNGSVLSWKGALAVGASATITYSVTVNQPGAGDGALVNTVAGGPSCAVQCSASTSTSVQSYLVEKTASTDAALPGDTVRYTVRVTNTSRLDFTAAAPATFTDDLSDVLREATYNGDATGGAVYTAPVLSWSGALAAGGTVTIGYSVTVTSPVKGDRSMVNTVVSAPSGSNCFPGSTDPRCTATVAIRVGDLSWWKVDATPGRNLLAGSAWRLEPTGGGAAVELEDCAAAPCAGADEDPLAGEFRLTGLRPGEYRLVETRAPAGFLLLTTPVVVTVTADGATELDPIVNHQVPVPVLPFTGGVGADTLTLVGGGLLIATAALAAVRPLRALVRRRRRMG